MHKAFVARYFLISIIRRWHILVLTAQILFFLLPMQQAPAVTSCLSGCCMPSAANMGMPSTATAAAVQQSVLDNQAFTARNAQPTKTFLPFDFNAVTQSVMPKTPVVETSVGTIQFGCPPESAKVWMRKKEEVPTIEVPTIYVLPEPFFQNGINFGDIEFPIYWYSFVKGWLQQGKKVTLIGTVEQIQRLKCILQETIFGPTRQQLESADHPQQEIERIIKESEYFAVKNDATKERYELEDFVNFVPFDSQGIAKLSEKENVAVIKGKENVFTVTNGKKSESVDLSKAFSEKRAHPSPPREPFVRPHFGITFLGTSSGFDPNGLTTSLIVWMNGRGLLVDPLAYVTSHMEALGISPLDVPDVLLTHVHGDHDAGLLEYILSGRKIRLFTSRVIYESFLRKARAITGQSFDNMVEFVELKAHVKHLYQDEFGITTRNNFHSIPTIGFLIDSLWGSLGYSGDTFYEPHKIAELVKMGVLTPERAQEIGVFQADHVFHEAGIAPIHTPKKPLEQESASRQQVFTLVHCCQPKSGEQSLPVARSGEQIVYESSKPDPQKDCLTAVTTAAPGAKEEILKFLASHASEIIEIYPPGQILMKEGDSLNKQMYIVLEGTVDVTQRGRRVARLGRKDYVGEASCFTGVPRSADVTSVTTVHLIRLDKNLAALLDQEKKVSKVAENFGPFAQLLPEAAVFQRMRTEILRDISACLKPVQLCKGVDVMREGDTGNELYIIKHGQVSVKKQGEKSSLSFEIILGRGNLVGEMAIVGPPDTRRQATVTVVSDTAELLQLSRADIEKLCARYPVFGFELRRLAETRKQP